MQDSTIPPIPEEKTYVLYNADEIVKDTLDTLEKARIQVDNCIDADSPSAFVIPGHPVTEAFHRIKERGIRVRFITEITKDNLPFCKELIKVVELRHMDEVKGNFGIADGLYYRASATSSHSAPPPLLICSTLRAFVEQQQYFYEMLWKKAIPALQRMREIEYGVEREVIETIQGIDEIKRLQNRLTELSNKEILLIIPDINGTKNESNDNILRNVQEIAKKRPTIAIRILCPYHLVNQAARAYILPKGSMDNSNIQLRYLEGPLQGSISILIIDNRFFLSTESERNDDLELPHSVARRDIATYSNSKSTVLSYVSIFNALWKQSDLYQQIKENNVELHHLNEIQKDFINIAAHELRNPIVPILNLSIVLQTEKGNLTKSDRSTMIDMIVRNAKRLQNLTEVLLDTAKIEGRTLHLRIESVNIVKQMQGIVIDFRSQMLQQSRGIGIQINIISNCNNESDLTVKADRTRVMQVVNNLLENATKFMDLEKQGRITINIEKIKMENEQVKVSIRDNGKGISSDIFPKLFLKFARKSETGTGLGLFICKGIVEAHGGRIWASNNVNAPGATVSFTLPLSLI